MLSSETMLLKLILALIVLTVPTEATDWWQQSRGSRSKICVVNPFTGRFVTRAVNSRVLDFFVRHGHLNGTCNQHCSLLCDDQNACTVDDEGTCEEDGCPAFPRKTVDCGIGSTCDSTLGCIPDGESSESPPNNNPSSSSPTETSTTSPQPTNDPTLTPSAAPSGVPSSWPTESTSHPTNAPSSSVTKSDCRDNLAVMRVNIDLQSRSTTTCNDDQWKQIRSTISATLNWEFTTVVPDWKGDVSFGPVSFDVDQQVVKLKRALRGKTEQSHNFETTQNWKAQTPQQRRLNECSSRRDIPCDANVCYWGCLVAPTTSCGVNSLANWAGLSEGIQVALADLEYGCLGSNASVLIVNLSVGDGVAALPLGDD